MRISDWSSDVCSSDLCVRIFEESSRTASERLKDIMEQLMRAYSDNFPNMYVYIQEDMEKIASEKSVWAHRSEEHTSELQSLMRISYAVFCLKNKNTKTLTSSTSKQHMKNTRA